MVRQHVTPLYIPVEGPAVSLAPLEKRTTDARFLESFIQSLVHEHPACLPISEIDPSFQSPIAICRELSTPAGPIDNFLVTPSGLPILVECKLWRNAEARREVVGQILDYAKELARFSTADLRREIGVNLRSDPDKLIELVRAVCPDLDEAQFDDALSANLRRGRFLLLIVGDGIREGVENIAAYLQAHSGLHFSLGLVELPIYAMPDGGSLVAPRVLAHTHVVTRTVVATPAGYSFEEGSSPTADRDVDPELAALGDARQQFWRDFLIGLRLDDPEQPIPKAPRMGWVAFNLPAPSGSSWLNVYRDMKLDEVGLFLTSNRGSAGEYAMKVIAEDWGVVGALLGETARLGEADGRPRILDHKRFESLRDEGNRQEAYDWLRRRTNTFINVLRPRVRSAAADYASRSDEAG